MKQHDNRGQHSKGRTGILCNAWKGGRKFVHGYVYITKHGHPNAIFRGYILEHRYLMSEYLGRPLKRNEIVHHKNHNISDNRIENLELITKKSHALLHNPRGWKPRKNIICAGCGILFMPKRPPRCKRSFCSRLCFCNNAS